MVKKQLDIEDLDNWKQFKAICIREDITLSKKVEEVLKKFVKKDIRRSKK